MSPLAHEILLDLQTVPEFAAGATLTALKEWLGEDVPVIVAALKELRASKYIKRERCWRRVEVTGNPQFAIDTIIAEVAQRRGLRPSDLTGLSKLKTISHARQEAIYEVRERTRLSFPIIGRAFNRDHSTAIHAHRVHTERAAGAGKARLLRESSPVESIQG